jgi:pentatricopeptide repeat protein
VLSALIKLKKSRNAERAFSLIPRDTRNIIHYNQMMHMLGKQGDVLTSEAMLQEMHSIGVFPDIRTYTSLLRGYVVERDYQNAEMVLIRMEEHSIKPNAVTCSTLMQLYAACGDCKMAEHVLERMRLAGLKPNEFTYTILLDAYANRSHNRCSPTP